MRGSSGYEVWRVHSQAVWLRSASSAVSWLKEPREKILFQSEKYPRAKIFHISRDGGRATPFPRLRYFFPPPNSPLLFFVQLRPKRVTIFTLPPPPPPLPVYNEYAEASFRFPTRKWYLASESSIGPLISHGARSTRNVQTGRVSQLKNTPVAREVWWERWFMSRGRKPAAMVAKSV